MLSYCFNAVLLYRIVTCRLDTARQNFFEIEN